MVSYVNARGAIKKLTEIASSFPNFPSSKPVENERKIP